MKRKFLFLLLFISVLIIIPNKVKALDFDYDMKNLYILEDQTSTATTDATSSASEDDLKKLVGNNNLCEEDGEVKKFFNDAWSIVCIFMPPLIILMASLDFFKAITTSDDAGIKNAANKSLKRALSFILLLMLRFILNTLFGWVNLPLCL